MWHAVNFNWPIKAYFHWSLVDNFEWERGWTQRFGLWALDIETQKRTKRPSAGPVRGDLRGEWAFVRDGAEILPGGLRQDLPAVRGLERRPGEREAAGAVRHMTIH